jgi:GTPase SAR1 family protein
MNEKKTSTMRAVRMMGYVNGDHTLRLDLPTHVEEGPAEVIVLVPEKIPTLNQPTLVTYFQNLERSGRKVKSQEEIDKFIDEERNSWERDHAENLSG